MIGAVLVGGAGIAAATPQDDAYLAQLRAAGLTWPPKTEEALIAEAHDVCYDLTWGWTPQQIADDLNRPGFDGGSCYWISTSGWSVRFVA
ncbi:hypothetical protein I549_3656 [Mycobacterium avium subsp. avium 2285 (R)]|nr:hypothetical protein I549_3656 [Mycobacterium avium subsp. avium 2285 (R)]